MFCSQCGKSVDSSDLFCSGCGNKLKLQSPSDADMGKKETAFDDELPDSNEGKSSVSEEKGYKKFKIGLVIGFVFLGSVALFAILFPASKFPEVEKAKSPSEKSREKSLAVGACKYAIKKATPYGSDPSISGAGTFIEGDNVLVRWNNFKINNEFGAKLNSSATCYYNRARGGVYSLRINNEEVLSGTSSSITTQTTGQESAPTMTTGQDNEEYVRGHAIVLSVRNTVPANIKLAAQKLDECTGEVWNMEDPDDTRPASRECIEFVHSARGLYRRPQIARVNLYLLPRDQADLIAYGVIKKLAVLVPEIFGN